MADHRSRFEGNAPGYDRFRPRYPASLLQVVAHRVETVPVSKGGELLDVGSGSGIFTRQLRAILRDDIRIVGVEPASAMLGQAREAGGTHALRFIEGSAEALPAKDRSIIGITAATAAHWFDRPVFYAEARRVLVPGGVLAVVEYVRDVENSPAARAVLDFLNTHGEPRAYSRPDYVAELRATNGFGVPETLAEPVMLRLPLADFVGLALSSSHAKQAVVRLSQRGAEEKLAEIGAQLAESDGSIPFGYLFQAFMATRLSCG